MTKLTQFAGAQINSLEPARLLDFYASVFGGERLDASRWRVPGYAEHVLVLRFELPETVTPGHPPIHPPIHPPRGPIKVNQAGYAHLCFEADDVAGVVQRIVQHGGALVSTFARTRRALGVYASDPDGNVIEVHVPFPATLTVASVLQTLALLLRIKLGLPPPHAPRLRFIHVNVIVPNWQDAVAFYERAVGALPTGMERNYKGRYIATLTGIPGAAVRGRHVALPGYAAGGPTLEVFTYANSPPVEAATRSDTGIVALDFSAPDLAAARAHLVAAGARVIDESVDDVVVVCDANGNRIRVRCAT
jgi:predicted enzyme related to lactoylglutathione lyase